METLERVVKLHCTRCLEGKHRLCRIVTPPEWEGGGHRCACKCATRRDTRLTNVERIAEEKREKAPKVRARPGPKARVGAYNGPVRPTKWTDAKIMQLVTLEKQGLTSRQIGERVGSHMDVVRSYLKVARLKGWR